MTAFAHDSTIGTSDGADQVLRSLFDSHDEAVMRYARRRTDDLAGGEEITAQTFVVA